MKLWEKYRRMQIEDVLKAARDIDRRWKRFSETGECAEIPCTSCPFYLCEGESRCSVGLSFSSPDRSVNCDKAKELLNGEATFEDQ